MSTIRFSYTDDQTNIYTGTKSEQLGAVVETFKEFLLHIGFTTASVERIMYVEGDHQGFARGAWEGFRRRDGNQEQGGFFDDGTDERSGV